MLRQSSRTSIFEMSTTYLVLNHIAKTLLSQLQVIQRVHHIKRLFHLGQINMPTSCVFSSTFLVYFFRVNLPAFQKKINASETYRNRNGNEQSLSCFC